MSLAAALLYWIVVIAWVAIMFFVCAAFLRNRGTFGTTRLLLIVLIVDAFRNVAENTYFGLYFGAQYGLFQAKVATVLGTPHLLILPKLLNVGAACLVLGVLLLRWLPAASRERRAADEILRQTSEALAQEIEEKRRIFETSLDLILVTDSRGNYTRASPSSQAILGYAPEELIGRSGAEFIYPPDLDRTRDEMRNARRGRHIRNFETRYLHKNGEIVELAWSGVWSEPERRHFFFGRDITESNASKRKLEYLALFDQLTGLRNRVSLESDVADLLRKLIGESGQGFSVALLDLSGVKEVNETLGHSFGDRVLQEVANRLRALVTEPQRVYRWGGNEFAFLLPACNDPIVATNFARSVLKEVEDAFQIEEHQVFIGLTAGIAVASRENLSAEMLLSSARLALHDARGSGTGTIRLYSPLLRARAQERRQIGNEIRRAWKNKEFTLHFQPQVQLHRGYLTGAEALIRWRHPERGLLPPVLFIEALAESPFALNVGRWILVEACRTAAGWRAGSGLPIRIGVNLFPAQFRHGALLDDVKIALQSSGLPAGALELEITENIALTSDDKLLDLLREIRSMGVGLAFDDFGTGFASLSYLARYPFTRIKIDRSFVKNISDVQKVEDTAIVRSIIGMAHNLGLKVTAEGVETQAQAEFLRGRKCDEAQGYLYAKPLSPDDFSNYVSNCSKKDVTSRRMAESH